MSKNTFAYISLGSNQGDTKHNLRQALDAVCHHEGISLLAASSIYQTEPQGIQDQPWFANQVAKLECCSFWTAQKFLKVLLELETALGRERTLRWGPRNIDLDLLLFGQEVSHDPAMTLPHPRMHQRAFVLIPLLEIEPEACMPDGKRITQLLEDISYRVKDALIWQP